MHLSSNRYGLQGANAAVASATVRGMNAEELKDYRIARLAAAIDKVSGGNKSEFGRKLDYADGAFIRQMLAGTRPVTEKTIMQIEALHGMAGWFAEGRAQQEESAIQSLDLLSPDELYGLMMKHLQDVEKLADSWLRTTRRQANAHTSGGENAPKPTQFGGALSGSRFPKQETDDQRFSTNTKGHKARR
jgi:hypothetical protein